MRTTVTIQDMVAEWLKAHKLAGLCNSDLECGCLIADLMPCGDPRPDCVAGRKTKCNCGEHDFHVEGVNVIRRRHEA